MAKMVLGLFPERIEAEEAINELENLGYDPKNISLLMKDQAQAQEVADSTGAHIAEGTLQGATTGGALGAIAGLLIGIGAITIPGVGALLIGGPLAAALGLTGAAASTITGAATGALAGGLLGALVSFGIPEEHAKVYEEGIREGGILVAVPTFAGRDDEAREVLEECGADQVRVIDLPEDSQFTSSRFDQRPEDYHRRVAYAESSRDQNWYGDYDDPTQTMLGNDSYRDLKRDARRARKRDR